MSDPRTLDAPASQLFRVWAHECERISWRARVELGHDTGGSLVDLLADNTPLSLEQIRQVLQWIGETK